jgi:GNAT superfamily N-acetyltransferase
VIRLAQALTLYREKGWSGLYRRVVRLVWWRHKYLVYRKSLCQVILPVDLPGIQFRVATSEDIPWLCGQMTQLGNRAEKILSQQFQRGDMTVIGVSEDEPQELVFSLWLSQEDFGLKLLNDGVGVEDVSIRRVWVRPTHRRMGLARQGLSFAEYVTKEAGISQLWSFVQENNVPSRKLHEKREFEDFGRIRFVKILWKRFARTRTNKQRKWTVCELPKGIVKL